MTYPSNSESVAQDQIVSYVRRIESIEDGKKALNDDLSEIYKEARGNGFDVKVLRKVIADRRKDASERAEFETIYELYWNAVHGLAHAHVENTQEFGSESQRLKSEPVPEHDAETGEIIEANSPEGASEKVGGFPVPAAPLSRGGTGGEEGDQTSQPENVVGIADVTAGETATNTLAGAPADEAEPTQVEASSVTPKRKWTHSDPAHRDCLNPEQCGGFSNHGLCQRCKDAAA